MATGRLMSLEEKMAQWYRAYDTLRIEMTPAPLREMLAQMTEVEGIAKLTSYMNLATAVMANDREAARVAAMLVNGNVRPPGEERDD